MIETIVNLDGKAVTIQATFYYPEKHRKVKDQFNTFCRISVLTEELNEKGNRIWKLFSEGHARRNKKDKFSKSLGRKTSFEHAVNQIKEKNIRSLLWNAFIEKFGVD